MEVRTEEKTEVRKTMKHTAMVEFDTLVVSERQYYRLLVGSIGLGEPRFKVQKAEYLPDDIGILQLNGELVATITLEE